MESKQVTVKESQERGFTIVCSELNGESDY